MTTSGNGEWGAGYLNVSSLNDITVIRTRWQHLYLSCFGFMSEQGERDVVTGQLTDAMLTDNGYRAATVPHMKPQETPEYDRADKTVSVNESGTNTCCYWSYQTQLLHDVCLN